MSAEINYEYVSMFYFAQTLRLHLGRRRKLLLDSENANLTRRSINKYMIDIRWQMWASAEIVMMSIKD